MIFVYFIITAYYWYCIITIKTAYCICHTLLLSQPEGQREALPGSVTDLQPVLSVVSTQKKIKQKQTKKALFFLG